MFIGRPCLASIFNLFVGNERARMTENKKRKLQSEDRLFDSEWTNKYIFAVVNPKSIVLSLPKCGFSSKRI